jgi:hypothetical protein
MSGQIQKLQQLATTELGMSTEQVIPLDHDFREMAHRFATTASEILNCPAGAQHALVLQQRPRHEAATRKRQGTSKTDYP